MFSWYRFRNKEHNNGVLKCVCDIKKIVVTIIVANNMSNTNTKRIKMIKKPQSHRIILNENLLIWLTPQSMFIFVCSKSAKNFIATALSWCVCVCAVCEFGEPVGFYCLYCVYVYAMHSNTVPRTLALFTTALKTINSDTLTYHNRKRRMNSCRIK